ncbi:max dimerization protein 4 [Agrilus planipennis]|uniref:Max dimerization protein 4 n=1 Tax=Agrilus planipennis TaxID=224129 RepID=A0A1W4X5T8_AGRPL|nr:max dimerization protein 4 [Agrilus planipennis]
MLALNAIAHQYASVRCGASWPVRGRRTDVAYRVGSRARSLLCLLFIVIIIISIIIAINITTTLCFQSSRYSFSAASTMSIAVLIEAAEYLERRNREFEHGYASSLPIPDHLKTITKRPKAKKSQGNRTSHNELEKNRRAHLRNCLEKLKDIVPLGPEASRHTTLGLLTKAKRFIKNLEEKERRSYLHKEQLCREQRYLRRRLDQLSVQHQALYKRRSVSECSTSTVSSSVSNTSSTPSSMESPISESDEVDVIGYTSTQSDTDDQSVRSGSSDSGVAMSTRRLGLTLSEMEVL